MTTAPTNLSPIGRTRSIPLTPDAAFDLFTSRMGEWWPLDTHALSDSATTVQWDDHVGGRVVEIDADGDEHPWAEITVWDPPRRFALAWHLDRDRSTATVVDVRFEPTGDGCVLHLEHSGWENMGDLGADARTGYSDGWEPVLDRFAAAV